MSCHANTCCQVRVVAMIVPTMPSSSSSTSSTSASSSSIGTTHRTTSTYVIVQYVMVQWHFQTKRMIQTMTHTLLHAAYHLGPQTQKDGTHWFVSLFLACGLGWWPRTVCIILQTMPLQEDDTMHDTYSPQFVAPICWLVYCHTTSSHKDDANYPFCLG